LPFVMII